MLPKEIIEEIIFYTKDKYLYFNIYYFYLDEKYYKNRFKEIVHHENYKNLDMIDIYNKEKKILLWIKKYDYLDIRLYSLKYKIFQIINSEDVKMIYFFYKHFDNYFNVKQTNHLLIKYPNINA